MAEDQLVSCFGCFDWGEAGLVRRLSFQGFSFWNVARTKQSDVGGPNVRTQLLDYYFDHSVGTILIPKILGVNLRYPASAFRMRPHFAVSTSIQHSQRGRSGPASKARKHYLGKRGILFQHYLYERKR